MRAPYTALYLHLVWSTWHRMPWISVEIQQRVYAVIARQAKELNADVLAIGGIEDHVHVLVELPTTVSVGELVGRMKGASSHFVTHVLLSPQPFKWQGGYGAFTVSRRHLEAVRHYVLNQQEHHLGGSVYTEMECTTTGRLPSK
jgi:REP element-mobilizing transposase RayT